MNWNARIRQFHRWTAIAFMAGFVANLMVMTATEQPAFWIYLSVLIPLFLLMPTGLFMLIQPHAERWRGARRATVQP